MAENEEKVTPEAEVKAEEVKTEAPAEEVKQEAAPEKAEEPVKEEKKKEEPKKEAKEEKPEKKKAGGKKIAIIAGIVVVALVAAVFALSFVFSSGAASAFNAGNYQEAYDKLSFPFAGLTMNKASADTIKYNYVVNVLGKEGKIYEGAKILETVSSELADKAYASGGFGLCKVGNVATLGAWEQDADTSNGEEPLEWVVLDVVSDSSMNNGAGGHRALIMTKNVIDSCGAWTKNESKQEYSASEVKSWCEVDFYKTLNANSDVKGKPLFFRISTEGDPEAVEVHAFILSAAEVKTYLQDNETLKDFLIAQGTKTAKKNGVKVASSDSASGYWLRDAGESVGFASSVSAKGEISYSGSITGTNGVRPCMWIALG